MEEFYLNGTKKFKKKIKLNKLCFARYNKTSRN